MQFSPPSRHFIPLQSKYSSQLHINQIATYILCYSAHLIDQSDRQNIEVMTFPEWQCSARL
jgi:hypothetical protein